MLKFQKIKLDKIQKMNYFRTKWVTHTIYNEPGDIDEKKQK